MGIVNDADTELKSQLEAVLLKGNAHVTFDESVKDLKPDTAGFRIEKLPYSIWQLIEHIRITQWDILEFCRNADHQSPAWPDEYWPVETAPAGEGELKNSISQIKEDQKAFMDLLHQQSSNLYEPFTHGSGQNLLREALLIADHTGYHTGQIILIRRLLANWGN